MSTTRERAVNRLRKQIEAKYAPRGWFWDGEARELYSAYGALAAARSVAESLHYYEYALRLPGHERHFYCYARSSEAFMLAISSRIQSCNPMWDETVQEMTEEVEA